MNQDYFTWVPFYSEFAEKLLSFAKDRSSLIEKIKAVYTAINMRLPKLEKDDHIVDIDPFTVFGLFNKGITDASRIAILQGIANEFSIKAAVPQAFNGIPVLNNQKATFYYFISDRKDDDMLAYAFQVLREQVYESYGTEEFENTADLLSTILAKGVATQIKRGLGRTYIEETESLSCLRGKIRVTESIKQQTLMKQQLICTYDEFSVDSYMNRILKTTMELLLRYDIPKARKKELRNLLLYFKEVNTLDVHSINWNFRFHRNNQTYQMLMSICYLVIKGLLQTSSDGSMKLMQFLDEQRMCRLYEKFILEYYKKHYPQIKTSASQIGWALDDGIGIMLPIMQSDIMFVYGDRTLIIDTKYYSHTTQKQYNVNTLHSNNLYQIFTYVKNKAAAGGEVSGMLLYARTDEEIQPDHTYMMSGNRISVKTLDLNCDFREIARQLNAIADAFIA